MSRPVLMRPYAFQPLEQVARCDTDEDTAAALGVNRRRIYRMRQLGLTVEQADELAVGIGMHPAEVWPDW